MKRRTVLASLTAGLLEVLSIDGAASAKVQTPEKNHLQPAFAEAIDARTRQSRLKPLRSYILPNDDLEVRIWDGFGLTRLRGMVLKRTHGVWSGLYLHAAVPGMPQEQTEVPLPAPRIGWSALWDLITRAGLLTLPDASELKNDKIQVLDGRSFVVEISRGSAYRTYHYENPEEHKRPPEVQFLALQQVLEEQFDVPRLLRLRE